MLASPVEFVRLESVGGLAYWPLVGGPHSYAHHTIALVKPLDVMRR